MNTRFIELSTPFENVTTVTSIEGDFFRPAATGPSEQLAQLALKMDMEAHEQYILEATNDPTVLSSAAHPNPAEARANAYREAVERISLSAWWAAARPQRSAQTEIFALLKRYPARIPVYVTGGYVPSIDDQHHVAFTILENNTTYPMAVLGGGCATSPNEALEKSFFEAAQSWTASEWLYHHKHPAPMWDIGELHKRSTAPQVGEKGVGHQSNPTLSVTMHNHENIPVALVHAEQTVTGTTLSLARLALETGEKVTIFTEHNQ